MTERLCPDSSVCFSCPARKLDKDNINNHYCDQSVFGGQTRTGALMTRPTYCPTAREENRKNETAAVTQQLEQLLRRR